MSEPSLIEQLANIGIVVRGLHFGDRLVFERPAQSFGFLSGNNCIGAFSIVNDRCILNTVEIGRYCNLAMNCVLGIADHPVDWFSSHGFVYGGHDFRPFLRYPEWTSLVSDVRVFHGREEGHGAGPVRLGNDVWLGQNVIVRAGVTIGDGAIIGAGSVVTKDVAPYMVMGGVPARPIRQRFATAIVERFMALRWWTLDLSALRNQVDYANVPAVLDRLEAMVADGTVQPLRPKTYSLDQTPDGRYKLSTLAG
ncbi:CatB-related O-acetyltransferase [Azospirillum soli]|uniref:CatB-related O-acetyltransferase n=1 Tax=Azospirillum soli TaxID=1304799 RepID=UPI001AE7B13C|nr:CatB-related O-acetyltransferase [Azospirillum soli]MBP2316830.1 acetyltransferase-like isoleucine patch superfamily enzyme [Azospirillum soli]